MVIVRGNKQHVDVVYMGRAQHIDTIQMIDVYPKRLDWNIVAIHVKKSTIVNVDHLMENKLVRLNIDDIPVINATLVM